MTSSGRLTVRLGVEYDPNGYTYYRVRAPHVQGTITLNPLAPPSEGYDPDAYTWLTLTFGRWDVTEAASSYTDRLSVYGGWLYGSIDIVSDLGPDDSERLRDPWSYVHRNTYELAGERSRERIRDVGETVLAHHRVDPNRHRQHAAYLRHIAPQRLEHLAAETAAHARTAHWLGTLETRQARWLRIATPRQTEGYHLAISGLLATHLDQQLSGTRPHTEAERDWYVAWSAASRHEDGYWHTPRRLYLPNLESAAVAVRYLTRATVEASGNARAQARCVLRRLSAARAELAPLITIGDEREAQS
jgi:hypothetical protein